MTLLACPVCRTETSQGAYVCHRCGYSYVHERSKPFFRLLLAGCLAACVVSAAAHLLALAASQRLTVASGFVVLLLYLLPIQYYVSRLRGRFAYFDTGMTVEPKRYGWVATDFGVLLYVGVLTVVGMTQSP